MGFDVPAIHARAVQDEINKLPEDKIGQHSLFLEKAITLHNKLAYESGLDFEVDRAAKKIEEINAEISPFDRVGYFFKTVGMGLLCPLSWLVGCVACVVLFFGPSETMPAERFFFRRPVEVFKNYYQKTFYSKDTWNQIKKELEKEKGELSNSIISYHKREIKPRMLELESDKKMIELPSMIATFHQLSDSVALVERKYTILP